MADYNDLLVDVAKWLRKEATAVPVATLIGLAETELYRSMRLQNMVTVASTTATEKIPTEQFVATVPDDSLQIMHLESNGTRLNYVSPDQMCPDLSYAFTIVNCLILVSNDAVDLDIYYYARPDPLTTTPGEEANWFTSNAYDILLYLAVAHGFAYLMDEAREGFHRKKAQEMMKELQRVDDRARYTDNPLVQRG